MKVLIVEDNRFLAKLFLQIFSLRGWAANISFSVSAALRLFEQEHHDFVFCDIELPDGDGVSLAKALLQAQPSLPVIMTSGSPKNLERARQAGLAHCLPKPFALDELRAMLDQHESFLRRKPSGRGQEKPPALPSSRLSREGHKRAKE